MSSWRHWENFLGSSGWKCSTRYCRHWINFHWTDSTMGADSNSQRSETKRFISFGKMIQWSIWVKYYTCRIYPSLSEFKLPRRSMHNWNQTAVVLHVPSCPVQTQGGEIVGYTITLIIVWLHACTARWIKRNNTRPKQFLLGHKIQQRFTESYIIIKLKEEVFVNQLLFAFMYEQILQDSPDPPQSTIFIATNYIYWYVGIWCQFHSSR